MRYIVLASLLITTLPCVAGIYMQKNTDGDITYSDVPLSNAIPVSLSPINAVPSTTPVTAPTTNNAVTMEAAEDAEKQPNLAPYNAFAITSPINHETIQNQPIITVKVAIDPALRPGDTVQVYLDGTPWGLPVANTNIPMSNVERGEHTLSAKLLDSSQNMLMQSDTIKIFVHRASANFQKAALLGQKNLREIIGI